MNNDRGEANCYICGASLPSLGSPVVDVPGRRRKSSAPATQRQATVGDRALALIFDRVTLAAFLMIIGAWQTSSAGRLDPNATSVIVSSVSIAVVLMVLYHVVLEAAFGTTLGKAMMALQVRTTGGQNRFVAALIRNALRLVDSIGFYLLGFLFAM
ncbi:MAG TPA: RDD family protein, partial [Thermoanaerobaculia bacterium]|nr:RDD family protein [Thermoanaerobaculia bacterium]